MRVGIFYIGSRPEDECQAVALPNGGTVYIRVEEVEAASEMDALDKAEFDPKHEALMNTHRLPNPTAD